MTLDSRRFLPPDAISRIGQLEVQARGVVEGFLAGMHRSPYFGQSVEFVQHREYVPGDDYRRIDWKAWSKTDKYYIKQYEEETNLRTTLLVDASESMQFGTSTPGTSGGARGTKHEYACSIAAALAYLLLQQHDGVGLYTFDQTIQQRVGISSKDNHLHAILTALVQSRPERKTGMYDILAQVADEQSRRGLIVIVSDFFSDRDSLFKGLRLLRSRGHDVMMFHVLDDAEIHFNFSGMTRFEGLEEAGELICDPKGLRAGYLAAFEQFLETIRRYAASHKIDYQTIPTSQKLDAALSYYLNHRMGMGPSGKR